MLYFRKMRQKIAPLILLLLWGVGQVACEAPAPSSTTVPPPETVEEPPIKDSLHRMKLIFVGDIMQHDDQIRSAVGDPALMRSTDQSLFDYEPVFRYVAPLLRQADLAVGNLELTLSAKGKYRGYPMFRAPDALAYALKEAGFDVLSTCNNHSNDGYSYGLRHTIEVLDSLGIAHTGTFVDTAAYDSLYPLLVEKEVDGTVFRLAFLSYTFSTNGIPTPKSYVVNDLDADQILLDVAKAKALNPDVIIALMHWGREYKLLPHRKERGLTRLLWEAGVDVVIGGHPHVIQPIEVDTVYNPDSTAFKTRLVTYSLGNFVSNQFRPNTDWGLMFELELVKNNQQQTSIGTHHYLPVWRYIHGRYDSTLTVGYDWQYTILPVSVFEAGGGQQWVNLSAGDSVEMGRITARLRAHLQDHSDSQERRISAIEMGILPPLLPTLK